MARKKGRRRTAPKIALEPAFRWECPSCGTGNYDDGVFLEITPQEQRIMADVHECDPSEFRTGDWLGAPETVKCSKCGDEFDVMPMELDEDIGPGGI